MAAGGLALERRPRSVSSWSRSSVLRAFRPLADFPTVSAPVTWDELAGAVETGIVERLLFTPNQVLERVERNGDIFADVLTREQKLPMPSG